MSYRLLARVSGLTLADYLLWNWSVSHNHDVVALISGLTLPPIAVAFLWVLAWSVARFAARTSARTSMLVGRRRARVRRAGAGRAAQAGGGARSTAIRDHAAGSPADSPTYSATPPGEAPGTLAA